MKATLCQIDGWVGATPTTFRLASHDDDRLCHLDGKQWMPAIARLPTLRHDFFDGSFEGQIAAPTGEMRVNLDAVPGLPSATLYDARLRLWRGDLGAPWASFSLLFDGRVREQPAVGDGAAMLSIGCDDAWLDETLLDTYAGTGDADGSAEIRGNVRQLLLGAPRFDELVRVDAVANIYQASHGAIQGVELLFDRLTRFGASSGDYASYAALKAATIAPGSWATCLAEGYIRTGAPPFGLLTAHIQGDKGGARGWVRKPGSIIHRIAERKGQLAKVSVSDLDALDAACPFNLSHAVTAQTTARELILSIAQSVNAVPVIDWLGNLRLKPIAIGAPIGTLASDGSAMPAVEKVEQVAVTVPWWRLAQKAAVTQRVHQQSEIAAIDLTNGTDAVSGFLTNEMHGLPADATGNVLSYAGATGAFKIFIGLDDVSASFTLSTQANPQALTAGYSGQIYTVTDGLDVGEPEASLTILASGTGAFTGLSLPKVFSLVKAPGGANAKTLTVQSDRQTIAYDAAGAPSPTTQTTTFTTNKQNTTATVSWSITDANGTARTPVATYLSAATGNGVTMTQAQFAAARNGTSGVIVTGSLTDGATIIDKISVVRVQAGAAGSDGTDGTDGSDGITAETTGPTAYAVPCNADGTPRTGALTAAAGTMHLRDAHTGVITSGVAGFIVNTTSGCTATINGSTGAYSFTAISADKATATFGCVYGGKTYTLVVSLNKVRDGKSSNQEADSATITSLTSGSYPAPDNEHADIDVMVPPGQTLTAAGRFDYTADFSGFFAAQMKVTYQNISDGGSETDLNSANGSTASTFFTFTDEWGSGYFTRTPGAVSVGGTLNNSSGSNRLYRLRAYGRRLSGDQPGTGTLSISGSTA